MGKSMEFTKNRFSITENQSLDLHVYRQKWANYCYDCYGKTQLILCVTWRFWPTIPTAPVIPSEKVFGPQKTGPNTVSEGVWSCRVCQFFQA